MLASLREAVSGAIASKTQTATVSSEIEVDPDSSFAATDASFASAPTSPSPAPDETMAGTIDAATLATMSAESQVILQQFAHLTAQLNTRFDGVETKVDDVKTAFTARVDNLETRIGTTETKVTSLEEVVEAHGKDIDDFRERIISLENDGPPPKSQSPREVLLTAIAELKSLTADASVYSDTIVMGARKSASKVMTKNDAIKIVSEALGPQQAQITPRGNTGVFVVRFTNPKMSEAVHLANTFLAQASQDSNKKFWCDVDKPMQLRNWEQNAFKFGLKFKGTDTTRSFRILQGFLVIGSTVIGPVNMIPSPDRWPALTEVIESALQTPTTFDVKRPLEKQLRTSITKHLCEQAGPAFIDVQDSDDWMQLE